MEMSGVVDFQSHTSYHNSIFIDNKIIDFIRPNFTYSFLDGAFNPVIRNNYLDEYNVSIRPGQPIYKSAPRMSPKKRYLENSELSKICIKFVEQNGGDQFFKRKSWKKELFRFIEINKGTIQEGRFQTDNEKLEEIKADLLNSRLLLEEKLNKKIHHLCYPWYVGSEIAVSASKSAGFKSNYWGFLRYKKINEIGQDPFFITRLSQEYLRLLPGRGRSRLLKILIAKAKSLLLGRVRV
jgi:hypothetical protein